MARLSLIDRSIFPGLVKCCGHASAFYDWLKCYSHEHVTEWVILKCMHNIWILPDVKQYTSSMNRKPIALTIIEMLGSKYTRPSENTTGKQTIVNVEPKFNYQYHHWSSLRKWQNEFQHGGDIFRKTLWKNRMLRFFKIIHLAAT